MLGILAINIAGFAGPPAEVYGPVSRHTDPGVDAAIYAVWLVVFEGKMRALFAILFGASMELFLARAEATGRNGAARQLRRLLWLALFGYLHFLLWWGDILFSYACAGAVALALRQAPGKLLLALALAIFGWWQLQGATPMAPLVLAEAHEARGVASAGEIRALDEARGQVRDRAARDLAEVRRGLVDQVAIKLRERPFAPLRSAWYGFGEALPYMLIGIVLLRSGFFHPSAQSSLSGWSTRRLLTVAAGGLALGGAATAAFAAWALSSGYPTMAMRLAIDHALGFPHLLMALGYAALLVLGARRLLGTGIGRRLEAAGRMAFSNYIAMTVLMTAIFYGWGLGLVGTVGTSLQAGFVLLGWVLMLGWSAAWLKRFRQGPLEWLWRSLVEWRTLPARR